MQQVYKKIELISIFAIVILALILRLYQIDSIPHGFFCDEAANGYNAYKLLSTGNDEYENFLPFYFRSFGDYRNPVSIYIMIPAIAAFGLNEFSVRFTMAILGTTTVLLIFLFTKELFYRLSFYSKIIVSLSTALYLAISPWHNHFSRTGFEFTALPFFLTLSLFFLFRFLRREEQPINKSMSINGRYLLLSAVFFIITFYTYYPIQLVLPPFLIGVIFIYKDILFSKKNRLVSFFSLLIFLTGLLPFFCGVVQGTALSRFSNVSPLAKTNNIKLLITPMLKTYLSHFSLDFLFKKGDIDMSGHFITRHSVRGMGELYFFQLPLLLIGFFTLAFYNFRIFSFLLLWLILFPIGSTVVGEGPFANRSIFGIIPFQILSGYGTMTIFNIIEKIKYKKVFNLTPLYKGVISGILLIVILNSFTGYLKEYFQNYPLYSSDFWGWQYGPRPIMAYFLQNHTNYEQLCLEGKFNAPQIFLKFYDPQNTCQNKCQICDPTAFNPAKRQLFAISRETYDTLISSSRSFRILHTIYYPNHEIAFLLGQIY